MYKTAPISYLAVLLIAITMVASPAVAQQPAGRLRIAVVDIDKVGDQYQALAEKDAELRQWMTAQREYLLQLEEFVFLSQENFKEVMQLIELSVPLPEDKATRLEELRRISGDKYRRYLDLQAKTERSAEEKEEFNSLGEAANARRQELAQLEEAVVAEYRQKVDDAQQVLLQEVDKIIAQYAQENGYDLVLDQAWVFYGGENITDYIIEQLNQPPSSQLETPSEAEVAPETPPVAEASPIAEPPAESAESGEEESGDG